MNALASSPLPGWSGRRKVLAALFSALGLAALACAAVYVSAALF
jgi:hypothetical protein